jgi:hypothetical protein
MLLIEVQRSMLRAEYQLLRGTTADRAMKRLDEAAELLTPKGESP